MRDDGRKRGRVEMFDWWIGKLAGRKLVSKRAAMVVGQDAELRSVLSFIFSFSFSSLLDFFCLSTLGNIMNE